MKKAFKMYALVWAVLFIVFQVVCFVTPTEFAGIKKFDGAFWPGYIFIDIAFVGQLVCAYIALKAENLRKLFYNLSMVTVSYTGLIAMLICGTIVMVIPKFPSWAGIILCALILAFTAVSVIKAKFSADIVAEIDEKIKGQTLFIKSLTVDAENLLAQVSSPSSKAVCREVYETVRYSEPMSHEALAGIESQITLKFAALKEAVAADHTEICDEENVQQLAEELIVLLKERNGKCKLMK